MAKPAHRVQLQKQESVAGGGDAADDDPMLYAPLDASEDAPDVAGVYLQQGALRDQLVTVYRDTDDKLWFEDTDNSGAARKSLLDLSGGGITEAQHEDLDTLTHDLAETSFEEVIRSAGRVTDVIIWTDSGKTTKVCETNVTRSGGQISSIVRKHYDATGTLLAGQTLTGTVARSGGQVASVDWVQT